MDPAEYPYALGQPTRLVDPDGFAAIPQISDEWKDCITKAWDKFCDKSKVSRKQLRCIMWCESRDKSSDVNKNSGATGLFQIQPEWWDPTNEICKKHKKWKNRCQDKVSAGESFDVTKACDNIECGVYLFCEVHGGDPWGFGTTRPKSGQICYDNCMANYTW